MGGMPIDNEALVMISSNLPVQEVLIKSRVYMSVFTGCVRTRVYEGLHVYSSSKKTCSTSCRKKTMFYLEEKEKLPVVHGAGNIHGPGSVGPIDRV